MIIRDLNEYVRKITSNELPKDLMASDSSFLVKLMGKDTDLSLHVGTMTTIAVNSPQQFFFEFIQNADDASADTFLIFFNDDGLLVVNNGEPLRSDTSDQSGELFSLLGKGKGKKGKEKNKIGEYGMGSKLLYDLLLDVSQDDQEDPKTQKERLIDSVIDRVQGPIIFSWKKWSSIDHLISSSGVTRKKGDYADIESPLLTKIVYSYYPSLPGEQRESNEGEVIDLFPIDQFIDFKEFFDRTFPKPLKHVLQRGGMMTYIPLGKGQGIHLRDKIVPEVIPGISTSLAFMNSVQTVWINDQKIQKHKFKIFESKTDRPKEVPFQILFLEDPISFDEDLANFYKFFPVTSEVHGFKFFIHAEKFELEQSRQRINEAFSYNQDLVNGIAKKLCEHLEHLAETLKTEEYLWIMKAIVASDEKNISKKIFKEKLYDPVLSALSSNLPTNSGFTKDTKSVIIRDFDLEISPSDAGLDDKFWLESSLSKYYDQVESKLGLTRWRILDLVQHCHLSEAFQNWLKNLRQPMLVQFFSALWLAADEKLLNIKTFELFEGSDEQLYSLQDLDEGENTFLLTPKLKKLYRILIKLEQAVVGKDIDWDSSFGQQLATHYEKDEVKLFERINAIIDANTLNYEDKWIILKNFLTQFDHTKINEKLRSELLLFCNTFSSPLPLRSLLFDHWKIASSGLLRLYQIAEVERNLEYQESFFMQKAEIWGQLGADWDEVVVPVLEERLKKGEPANRLYQDLAKVANSSNGNGTDFPGKKIVITEDASFSPEEDVFWNENFIDLPENKYQAAMLLIKKLSDFSCFGDREQYQNFTESPFELTTKGYREIADRLLHNETNLEGQEINLLPDLAKNGSDHLFGVFVLSRGVDGQYLLRLRERAQYEYYSDDQELNEFLLDKSKWVLLPAELQSLFQADNELRHPDEQFALDLINTYGSQPKFINLVSKQSDRICRTYLSRLDRIDLSSRGERYAKNSYESRLLKMVKEKHLHELIIDKVYVDNLSLGRINVEDTIPLTLGTKMKQFSLSKLLPEEYEGVSDIFHRLKSRFEYDGISHSPIFNSSQVGQGLVKFKILQQGISTSIQVAYLVVYKLSDEGKSDPSSENLNTLVPAEISSSELLDQFFQQELNEFSNCFQFKDFIPNEKVFTSDEKLLVDTEVVPQWVMEWMVSGRNREDKELFLKKSGVGKPDHPVLSLRLALKKGKNVSQDMISRIRDNPFFLHNTLEWARINLIKFSSASKQAIALRRLIPHAIEQEDWRGHFLELVEVEEDGTPINRICLWESNKIFYYYRDQDFLPRLLEGARQKNAVVAVATKGLIAKDTLPKLQAKGFQEASVKRILVDVTLDQENEWKASYYQKWLKKEGEKYRIYLYLGKIPFEYKFYVGSESWTIGQHSDGDAGAHDLSNGIREILVNKETAQETSVLDILEQNVDELFGKDKNALLSLFRLATPKEKDLNILTQIAENPDAKREIEKFLETGDFSSRNGDGNTQLDKDLSAEQQRILNKFVNQLKENNWQSFEEYLEQILAALDHLEDEAKPDSIVGFIGEQLMLKWLQMRNPHAQVVRVADETREFDIVFRLPGREYEIDVKTTIKSIQGAQAPLPFYIKPSQYNYVKNSKKDNYYISRLSLDDLGLSWLAEKYSSLNNNREKIERSIDQYFSNESNHQRFHDMQMTFRVSYDSFVANFL